MISALHVEQRVNVTKG